LRLSTSISPRFSTGPAGTVIRWIRPRLKPSSACWRYLGLGVALVCPNQPLSW